MLDVTIVADNAVLDAHSRKIWYYDVPDIRNWIALNVSGGTVHFLCDAELEETDGPCTS